jgi:anti-sigma factor RsiW
MTLESLPLAACKDVVELVTEYLSGALSEHERALLEQHLLVCPPCTAYLVQIRQTIDLARSLGQDESAPLSPRLLAAFRSWKAK